MPVSDKNNLPLIRRELEILVNATVVIGPVGGGDLQTIASTHEFGSPENNIPERSYLRSTAGDSKVMARVIKEANRGVDRILEGAGTALDTLNAMGVVFTAAVKRKIATGPFQPLHPETIRRKKSSRPLIDTSRLLQSMEHEVRA